MKEFIDKLIERLEEEKQSNPCRNTQCKECKYTNKCYEGEMCYKVGADNIISIANELAEEYINCSTDISTNQSDTSTISKMENVGWIPCERELPKENQIVMCSVKKEYASHRIVLQRFDNQEYWHNGIIEAWCELPAPYTEGE